MITTVNHKVIECDICKGCEEFASSLIAPKGWEKIHFSNDGVTYQNVDVCPECADKVKKFIESIEMERY